MNSLYGNYRTRKFTDIYPTLDSFVADYNTIGFPVILTEVKTNTLYYLLYARYGNSHLANSDEQQFKMRLFGTVYSNGLKWSKRLEAQEKLASLTEEEILRGNKSIFNHALNPGDVTTDDTELDYINDQNINLSTRSKISAYAEYYDVFQNCTDEFIDKFKNLFLTIVEPERPLWYTEEEETEVE